MANFSNTHATGGAPTYLGRGDPAVSRLLRETLAGTPYAERFLAGEV